LEITVAGSGTIVAAHIATERVPSCANRSSEPLLTPLYGEGDGPAEIGFAELLPEAPRVMMYSPDGVGLGHMRRNANIASRFVESARDASVLMVGGAPTGLFFQVPLGVDYLKLPSIKKVDTNQWEPRSLKVTSSKLGGLRAELIQGAAGQFEPQLVIVDHLPAGVWAELVPTLKMFRRMANPPRVIMGLRDVLDTPAVVRETWRREGVYDLLTAYYDGVFIYGSKAVYDSAAQYGLDLPGKVHYCGYVCMHHSCRRPEHIRAALNLKAHRFVLVSAGGGTDSYPMMEACTRALRELGDTGDLEAVLVTGPLMPQQQRQRIEELARGHRIHVLGTVVDSSSLMNAADLVITMGGYNTVMEAMSLGKKILVMPREGPSAEQRTRAALLADMGLIRALELRDATPARLAGMILEGLDARSVALAALHLNGARTVVAHMKRELAAWHAADARLGRAGPTRRAAG
jgi:predicted glycosyltransferase